MKVTGISIVIPAYNEAGTIADGLKEIRRFFSENLQFDPEIIVVNDGSKDNTSEVVRQFSEVKLIENITNQGKGFSVKRGILNSSREFVLFLDADLAIPIHELQKVMDHIDDHHIVIGSKYLKTSSKNSRLPFHRKIMGKVFSFLVKIISGLNYSDTQCGFKLFKSEAAKDVFEMVTVSGWCFDVEMLLIAKQKKFKVKEVAVDLKDYTPTSQVKPIKTSIEMLMDLLKIRYTQMRIRDKY